MKNPYLNMLKNAWEFSYTDKKKLVRIYIIFFLANCINMIRPYLIGQSINILQSGKADMLKQISIYLSAFLVSEFIFWVFHGPNRVSERKLAFQITKNYKEYLYNIITKLPLKWHKDNHSGDTINRINKASNALNNFNDESFQYTYTITRALISFIAIVLIMPSSSFFAIFLCVVVVFTMLKFDKKIIKDRQENNRLEHKVAAVLHDYISNISTILTLRLEKLTKLELIKKINGIFPVFNKFIRLIEWKWFSINMIMASINVLILLFYIYLKLENSEVIMIGTFVMLYQYMDSFMQVFYDLAWKYEQVVFYSTDLKSIDPILESFKNLPPEKPLNLKKISHWKEIKISNLNFSYNTNNTNEQKKHLKDINLVLKRGKKIALVGSSGSGKSTLLTVLRGLEQPEEVSIKIDEQTIENIDILSNLTTLIPQDPEIFEHDIKYNITIGIPHSLKEIEEVSKLSCFDNVVSKLEKKFDTNIREKGVNLSGGEKQRLALARGIFAAKESSLILLDEPTSSIDSINEKKIYTNLFNYFKDKCVISTIHRLNLLYLFDYIYLIKDGKIIEEGSLDELLKNKLDFYQIWQNYLVASKSEKKAS